MCTFMSSFTELTFVFCVYSRHLQQNKTGWFSSVQMQLVEYHISLCRLNILCFGVWNLVGRFTFVSCSNLVVMMSFLKINIVICYTRVKTLTMSLYIWMCLWKRQQQDQGDQSRFPGLLFWFWGHLYINSWRKKMRNTKLVKKRVWWKNILLKQVFSILVNKNNCKTN